MSTDEVFSGSGGGVHVSSGGVHGGKLQILCPPMRHHRRRKSVPLGWRSGLRRTGVPKNRGPQKRGSLRTRFPNNAPSLSGPSENGAEEASPLPVHKGSVVRVRRKRGRGSKAGETPQRGKQSMGAGESLSRSPLREAPLSSRGIPLSSPFYCAAPGLAPLISRPLIPGDPTLVDLLDEGVPI